jgi:hypothetical protein
MLFINHKELEVVNLAMVSFRRRLYCQIAGAYHKSITEG